MIDDQIYLLALVYSDDIRILREIFNSKQIKCDVNFIYPIPLIRNYENVLEMMNDLLLINEEFVDLNDLIRKHKLFNILKVFYQKKQFQPNPDLYRKIAEFNKVDLELNDYAKFNFSTNELFYDLDINQTSQPLEPEKYFELTLLKVAVIMEYEEMVKLLLNNGASIYPIERTEIHPIHLALYQNNMRILKILLHKVSKKDIEMRSINKLNDTNGFNPLHLALYHQNIKAINYVCRKGADLNFYSDLIGYSLIWAIESFDISKDVIAHMLRLGANSNVVDKTQGHSPLIAAILVNRLDLVKLLIEHGANVNHTFDQNNSNNVLRVAVDIANQQNDTTIVELLLKSGAHVNQNLNLCGIFSSSSLDYRISNQNPQSTALVNAIRLKNVKLVEILLKYGAYPHTVAKSFYSPISNACVLNSKEIVHLLLCYNVDPTINCYNCITPLTICLSLNYEELALVLLEYYKTSDSLNKQDKNGDFALLYASLNKNSKMVRKLLEMGADPNMKNKHNVSALWYSVYNNDKPTFFELIAHLKDARSSTSSFEMIKSHGIDYNSFQSTPELIYDSPLSPIQVAETNEYFDFIYLFHCLGVKIDKCLIERIRLKLTTSLTNEQQEEQEDEQTESFNSSYENETNLSSATRINKLKLLNQSLNRPISLKRLCRNKMRKSFCFSYLESLFQMGHLPNDLKSFLFLAQI